MTRFQLVLTGIFGIFLVIGVLVFSMYRGSSQDVATVVVWGTIPKTVFDNATDQTSLYQNELLKVEYVEKSEEDFDTDFIEALAAGHGPDLFMLPSDKIVTHRNKIFPIPYNIFTERQFKDSFIEGAEIYMAPEGTLGLPIYVDPLVMYWNRDIFTENKLTAPPKYWDEFYSLAELISKKDGALNISKSAVALGEFGNISHAKEIILNLALQAGTKITEWANDGPRSVFGYTYNKPIVPADAAVNFYTEFGNPAKTSYSWNRSLPNSTTYFLGGDLALYFGYASEISGLQLRNPNLNFDVKEMPTSREGGTNVSLGKFVSFAITKASKNANAAFSVASVLSGVQGAQAFSQYLKLPSTRRDLLTKKPTNAYESVFRDSAIRTRGWLDPNPTQSNAIFQTMIESITSGRVRSGEAVSRAERELSNLLAK